MNNKEISTLESKWNQFQTEKKIKKEQELSNICLTAQTRFITYDEVIECWDGLNTEGKIYGWGGKQMPEVGRQVASYIVQNTKTGKINTKNYVSNVEDKPSEEGFKVYYTPYVYKQVEEKPIKSKFKFINLFNFKTK